MVLTFWEQKIVDYNKIKGDKYYGQGIKGYIRNK